ncbi:MAG: flagellar assembly peptidoglycan hydrolase FlgJ [Oxalobacteraceae bacterium]|nr:flagellar assembly peptidoglycan hydrolase FlgJ [Oxalobacteraceae bacterium]
MINQGDLSGKLAIDANSLNDLRQLSKQNSPEALKATAKQFEALLMGMMLKSMRQASAQDGMFDNEQSRMYTSMLDQQLSQTLASKGMGLADVLTRQLSNAVVAPQPLHGQAAWQAPISGVDMQPALKAYQNTVDAVMGGKKSVSSLPAHVRAFRDRLMSDAEAASKASGIPAKFMLAQAALESGWGRKQIIGSDGTVSHNLFGIKATGGWKGRVVEVPTTEYVNGAPQRQMQKFRAYDSYAESFQDYAKLMLNNPRYENVLANATDVKGFAQGLQRAGYATDPNYADKLTRIINNSLSG